MKKRGQVWIETVIYTLIGLTLMGLALGFIMPKINEARDKALVEQAINSLAGLDGRVNEVIQTGTGNVRQAEFLMKKGELYINANSDNITMVLSGLAVIFSEPGVEVNFGRVKVVSEIGQKTNTVYLRLDYKANLTYFEKDEDRKFTAASTPYRYFIENKGPENGQTWVNIEEISNR
jgi:hypothetical protein